ncbi:hypothetical protein [Mycobacterium dioxanotrophicus]|nr:hypothetical protein [Mycobacterium dioxanotrophicus]
MASSEAVAGNRLALSAVARVDAHPARSCYVVARRSRRWSTRDIHRIIAA